MSEWITTGQAAEILKVTDSRIRQLIAENKLPAQKFGHVNMIDKKDLELVKDAKRGRPPKVKGENE
jgi:excisionase family DNA binding protein